MFDYFTDTKSSFYQRYQIQKSDEVVKKLYCFAFHVPTAEFFRRSNFTVRLPLCPHLCHQTQLGQIQHKIFILFEKAMCEKIRRWFNLSLTKNYWARQSGKKLSSQKQKIKLPNLNILYSSDMEFSHLRQKTTMIFDQSHFEGKWFI